MLHAYNKKADSVIATLKGQLHSNSPAIYKDLPKEYQDYSTYLVTTLKSQGIFDADAIDNSDESTRCNEVDVPFVN